MQGHTQQKPTKESIVSTLQGRNPENAVALLQQIFLAAPESMDAPLLDSIQSLAAHQDLGVRFWAKKVYNKYAFQFCRDEPERFAETAEEDNLPLELLIKFLQDVRHSRFLALKVLKKICRNGSPKALEVLTAHLKATPDTFQISFLTKNLGIHFPSDSLIPLLTPYLTHSDHRVIANTIEGLEAIGSTRCFEIISQFLKHRNNRVRATAAKALSGYDSRRTQDILTKMLGTRGQPHVVISACHAAAELRDSRFFPYLLNLLNDDLVLDDALAAMKCIDEPRTIEMLQAQIGQMESRLERMRRHLPGLPQVLASNETLAIIRKSPAGAWLANLEWVELLFNRVTIFIFALLLLLFAGSAVVNRLQNPQVRKAREELAKQQIPFSGAAFNKAISANNRQVIDRFLQAGIKPNLRDANDATPLHVAAYAGNTGLIDRLVALGADVTAADAKGLTPLHLAASREVAERLVKAGANTNARDALGRTPLHTAAETGATDIIELLVTRGADINAQARDGNTPLHLAIMKKRQKAALYLLARGANPEIRNQAGLSPRAIGLPTSVERKGAAR